MQLWVAIINGVCENNGVACIRIANGDFHLKMLISFFLNRILEQSVLGNIITARFKSERIH
jgi:hypothetical protein